MKTYRLISRIMATILLCFCFPSCISEVEEFFVQDGTIRLTSEITSTSRVTDQSLQSTRIVEGQQVGVTITGAGSDHDNVAWVVGKNGSLSNTGSAVYWGTTNATITAYHPYHSSWTGTNHTFTVSTDQSTDEGYLNSDLLWATTTASATTNPVALNFTHKLSKINVTLVNKGNENISNATITLCGVNVATGFNPQTGELYAIAEDIADIKASVTTDSAYTASAIIVPQTLAQGTNFIKITFKDKDYHYTLPEDQVFESGQAYQFTIEVNISDNSNAKTDYVDLKFGMPGVSASYNSATGSLTMTYPSGSMPRVKEGKAIVLPADYGFDIRVIESYSVSGNTLIMKTSKGNMGNLFRNTSFTLTTDADVASRSANTNVYTPVAYGYVDEKGIYHEVYNESRAVYPIEQFNWEFKKDYNGKILYEGKAGTLKWDKCEFSAGVKGTFTFDFGEKTISEVRKVGDLRRMDYKLTGNIDMDMLLHYNYKYEYEESGDEIIEYNAIPMMEMTFSPIIAGVPVPIHLQIYTHLGKMYACHIEGEVDATAGVKAGNEITMGLEWTPEGGAKPIKEAKPYFEFYPLTVKAQASAEAKVSYYPQWEIGIYNFKAIWLEPRPYLKEKVGAGFRASTDGENYIGWKAETYNGMDLRMGLETDFGFWRKDVWTSDIYNVVKDQLLFEAPSRITTLSPENNVEVEKGDNVDAEFMVESFSPITNKYYPCPWALVNFEPECGELDKPLAMTDFEGKATVNWTPSPSADSRSSELKECTLTAKVVDKEGTSIDEARLIIKTEEENYDELREALIKLYNQTDGDNWYGNDNWCSDKPIETWAGIQIIQRSFDHYGVQANRGEYFIDLRYKRLKGDINVKFPESANIHLMLDGNLNQLNSLNVSGSVSLKSLTCSDVSLNSLDVSECKGLELLDCSSNQISSLDISGCTALAKLYCRVNQLNKLDVSGCTALTKLNCETNQLSSLDISDCTALAELDCGGNQLNKLDVSGCTALTFLNVNWCNSLTHLNASGCSLLDFFLSELCFRGLETLEFLDLSGTKCTYIRYFNLGNDVPSLKHVNFSDCKSLRHIEIGNGNLESLNVSGCTSLEELSCNDHNLTSLNVSGCTALTKLSCAYNEISSLDVSDCSALKSLSFDGNQFSSLDFSCNTILERLGCSYCHQLKSLDVSECTALTFLGVDYCESLTHLNASGCSLLDIFAYYDSIWGLKSLEFLDLSGTKCTYIRNFYPGIDAPSLKHVNLSDCRSLRYLEINRSNLEFLNVSGCTALEDLSCGHNQLTSLNVSGCTALTELSCVTNKLSSLDVSDCTALKVLSCSGNKINSVIPDWFSQLKEFGHDKKYKYWKEWSYSEQKYVTKYETNPYGWWYPGEPNKGEHSPD